MLSQENIADQETDWKKQYAQTVKELGIKEKEWEQQQQDLLKSVLRLSFSFQGANDILDKKLLDVKEAIKKSEQGFPQKEIDELVQTILTHKKDKDADTSRTNMLINNVLELLSNEHHYAQYTDKVRNINDDIQKNAAQPLSKLKPVNDVVSQINKGAKKDKQKPDTFKVFLKKLSEHQNTEPTLAELCKNSIALKNEQEKLKAINACIDKINDQQADNTKKQINADNNDDELDFNIEQLLTLIDWITIPGKSQAKLDTLKKQLEERNDGTDIANVLRRIALTISNAYMEIQADLNETQAFLKKVTNQLNEITLQIADIETLEQESLSNSTTLNSEMEKQITLIQSGIDEADSIEEIKSTINTRIEVIQNNMDQFINVEQNRKKQSDVQHKQLLSRLNDMESESEKLRKCIEEERNKAYKDALTGAPNRLAFDERFNHEYQRWQRYKNKLTLCLVDIDKFKGVNDTYGHKAGDIVLRTVAKKCMSKVRKSDFFSRYGGEEFALLLPETELTAAISVAETLRASIENCGFQYADKDVSITISCGLAELRDNDKPDALFERADKALYKAKETGRNRCVSEKDLHVL